MGVLYDRVTNEEIDFLIKIKGVLNKKFSTANESEEGNQDYITFIQVIDDIYKLAIDMELEK